MEWTGQVQKVYQDYETGKYNVLLTINADSSFLVETINKLISHLLNKDLMKISIDEYKDRRSLKANNMLWSCIGQLAKAQTPPISSWDMYLNCLRDYGEYVTYEIETRLIKNVEKTWRETQVVSDPYINEQGKKCVTMNCYFGSSTYDTKQFSVLLDGVIADMKDLGLQPPPTKEMQEALKQWEKMHK
jgi:hypothetical protein